MLLTTERTGTSVRTGTIARTGESSSTVVVQVNILQLLRKQYNYLNHNNAVISESKIDNCQISHIMSETVRQIHSRIVRTVGRTDGQIDRQERTCINTSMKEVYGMLRYSQYQR